MILITRPKEDAIVTKSKLQAIGLKTFTEPLIDVKPLKIDAQKINQIKKSTLLVTSKNAIRALDFNGQCIDLKIIAMTKNIRDFALLKGFLHVDYLDCQNVFEFISLLPETLRKGENIVYCSGLEITYDISLALINSGFKCRRIVIYNASSTENLSDECIDLLNMGQIKYVTLFSLKTAQVFCFLLKKSHIKCKSLKYFVLSKKIHDLVVRNRDCKSEDVFYPNLSSHDCMIDLIKKHSHIF